MKGQGDKARATSGGGDSEAWYVAEGKRGEQLLDQGQVAQATEIFEALLARLGDAPSYARAVILGRLGRCLHVSGRPEPAMEHLREAMSVAGRLAPSDGVKSLRGTLRSELGDALRAGGHYSDARKAYEAALKITEQLKDLRGQAVDQGRLGALALTEGNLEEALTRLQAALRLLQLLHEPELEAAAWQQLGRVHHEQRQWDEAGRHYQQAARISEQRGHLAAAAQTYGLLANVIDHQSRATTDDERRAALEVQAREYRELHRHLPVVFATLARIGRAPSYGRAVILGQLGRCFHMARRPDLAAACASEAIGIIANLAPAGGAKNLAGVLHSDLGDMLRAVGQDASAREAYEAALRLAEELRDHRGQAHASQRLGRIFPEEPRPRNEDLAFEVAVYEDTTTDYAFDTDLLVDGPRERRITRWTGETDPLAVDVRPMLLPCTRTWTDDEGAVRFSLPPGDPLVEPHPGCTVIRRIRRELAVSGNSNILWRLIQGMNGARTVAEILTSLPGLPASERAAAAQALAMLAGAGAIDVSGRPVGRFLHLATKKGVLPAGGLEGDEVLRLATDGNYREYPDAPRFAVSESVPDRLRTFHMLTRSRRSSRDYHGLAVGRGDFDALLNTACGVTGTMAWTGRDVKLRAYPSSGALYAVEIYPVVFHVEGLAPAVYHYRAVENVLEVVKPDIDPASFVGAALPVERAMVAGAAALFCLAGCFARHERKYGEGGYRMLVAEAGHVSQNLVLAATALGLSARPFGGVFDSLFNHDLGLDDAEEQFLLAVVVGRAGERNE